MNLKMDITEKYIQEMSQNYAKIIDEFVKVNVASRWQDYFSKQKQIDFRRMELVIQQKSPTETVYFCRLKKGKLASTKKGDKLLKEAK